MQPDITWFGFCLLLAGVATADEMSARSCTGIADRMARLACYDAAFGVPGVPQSAQGAPPPAVAKAPEDSFGDTGNLRGSQKPVSPKRLTATVLNVVPLGQGLYRLTLDNGQNWQTTQADGALDFHPSSRVTISRMTFGNYLISFAGQGRTVSVKRIQ